MRKSRQELLLEIHNLGKQIQELSTHKNLPEGCAQGAWCNSCVYAERRPVWLTFAGRYQVTTICMKGACQHFTPQKTEQVKTSDESIKEQIS